MASKLAFMVSGLVATVSMAEKASADFTQRGFATYCTAVNPYVDDDVPREELIGLFRIWRNSQPGERLQAGVHNRWTRIRALIVADNSNPATGVSND